ncbi:MAG: hypothetical protein IKU19_09145, partial [Clostridia bacterium]|nr:hypothetical protein [Clostridia bacterium]
MRKRPGVIFGCDGDEGVKNYLEMLLNAFVTEVVAGYSKKIEINLYKDASVEIISHDSGILLSEEIKDTKPEWYNFFCEIFCGDKLGSFSQYDDYNREHNALFGRDGYDPKILTKDGVQFDLCCVQYASDFMHVESVRDGIKKNLEFKKGYSVSDLIKENLDVKPYTRIHCKPDPEVFSEYGSMRKQCRGILKDLSVCVPGFVGVLYDEKENSREEFYTEKGASDGICGPLYQRELTATGKERYNHPDYTATVRLTVGFDPEKKGNVCYHNCRSLEFGGEHHNCAVECIRKFLQYEFYDIYTDKGIDLNDSYIFSRIRLVIESSCDYSAVKWDSAA